MKLLSLLVLIVALAIWAGSAVADENLAGLQQDAVETYAEIVYASYQDSLELAVALNEALIAFVSMPDESTLAAAREAWLAANEPYGQTEAYRFYGGPIEDEDGPEGLLNAWPLDEAYIDYVDGDADAGIVNNTADYPEITKDLLISLNEVGAEENISTGYHAIEFLLWGQDLYEDSAGQRSNEDYSMAANAERRGQNLLITGELLVENLQDMVDQWDPANEDNYRHALLGMSSEDAITNMLTGIGVLAQSDCQTAITGGDPEISDDDDLLKVALYLSSLAVPAQRDFEDETVQKGERLFNEIGCGYCQVDTHETGIHPFIPALSH